MKTREYTYLQHYTPIAGDQIIVQSGSQTNLIVVQTVMEDRSVKYSSGCSNQFSRSIEQFRDYLAGYEDGSYRTAEILTLHRPGKFSRRILVPDQQELPEEGEKFFIQGVKYRVSQVMDSKVTLNADQKVSRRPSVVTYGKGQFFEALENSSIVAAKN